MSEKPPKFPEITNHDLKKIEKKFNAEPESVTFEPTNQKEEQENIQPPFSTVPKEKSLEQLLSNTETKIDEKQESNPFKIAASLTNQEKMIHEDTGLDLEFNEAVLQERINEDTKALDDESLQAEPIAEDRQEGYKKNLKERQDILDAQVGDRNKEIISEKQGDFDKWYEEEKKNPDFKKENDILIQEDIADELKEGLSLFSWKEGFSQKNQLQKLEHAQARSQEHEVEFPKSKKELLDSIKKVEESRAHLEKRDKEYSEKNGWEKTKDFIPNLFGRGADEYRAQRDRVKMRESALVDKIVSNPHYPGGKIGQNISKFAVKSTSGVFRNTIPALGLGIFFIFAWGLDKILNFSRKKAEKIGGPIVKKMWERKPAPKADKKKK